MAAMRKLYAWLGAATLLVLVSVAQAGGPTVLKPYVVLILDTSGSMIDVGDGNPTGYGPPTCVSSWAAGNVDNKLNDARCAIDNIANSYGDIVFGFGRFRNSMSGTTTPATFPTGCCSHGPDSGASGGCPAGPTCTGTDEMFELLTPLIDGNNAATASWVNGTANTCTAAGTDPRDLERRQQHATRRSVARRQRLLRRHADPHHHARREPRWRHRSWDDRDVHDDRGEQLRRRRVGVGQRRRRRRLQRDVDGRDDRVGHQVHRDDRRDGARSVGWRQRGRITASGRQRWLRSDQRRPDQRRVLARAGYRRYRVQLESGDVHGDDGALLDDDHDVVSSRLAMSHAQTCVAACTGATAAASSAGRTS